LAIRFVDRRSPRLVAKAKARKQACAQSRATFRRELGRCCHARLVTSHLAVQRVDSYLCYCASEPIRDWGEACPDSIDLPGPKAPSADQGRSRLMPSLSWDSGRRSSRTALWCRCADLSSACARARCCSPFPTSRLSGGLEAGHEAVVRYFERNRSSHGHAAILRVASGPPVTAAFQRLVRVETEPRRQYPRVSVRLPATRPQARNPRSWLAG